MKSNIRVFTLLSVLLLMLAPAAGMAQETTSAIRGKVQDSSGENVADATIVVQDMRTGVVRTYTTNNAGAFLAPNLPVGGPFKVTVNGVKSVMVESISLGDTYNLSINMQTDAMLEEVVVVGQAAELVDVAAGPAATFSSFDVETAVAFNRDITDVYGLDPRLNIDIEDDGFQVNCGGQHPRFNSVTLDGVSYNDRFGLNSNGYSTATGMPFPYDGIEQVAVELAPFDVTYGGFSACNINAVTKTGTNEWDGSVFYEWTTETLRGDSLDAFPGQNFRSPDYKQEKKGFSLGGPIIKDRLFFFVAWEDTERPRFLARGYDGSGKGEEREWLSEAEYNRVVDIANNLWGYDPGGMPGDGVQEDEKYMLRLDWNISDNHNAAVIYNYYEGFQDRDSDGDQDEFEFANHFYVKGAESETYTLKLSSQWTDNFSTEFFYSQNEMNDSQVTVGPKDFGDFQINDFAGNTIYLGADDSRQANKLGTESEYFKLTAQWLLGNHILTIGYEREEVDIFNIFVQHSRGGEWDFYGLERTSNPAADCGSLTAQQRYDRSDCNVSGIDQFELGLPSRIYYGSGGGTNNPNDAAASFANELNTFYLQDEIFFDDINLTLVAGFRYDWFTSDDRPKFNPSFYDQFGIPNNANVAGLDLWMPRIGFTWEAKEDLTVRGGVGLYSGGNPNVWISNAWSNDGLTNAQFSVRDTRNGVPVFGPDAIPLTGDRPGYDVPLSLYNAVANVTEADANTGFMVLIDPDYKQPSVWKFALGFHWDTPWWGVGMDVDYLHSRQEDPAYYVDVSQSIQDYTAAGQPIYDYTYGFPSIDNFMLTNSNYRGKSDLFSVILTKDFDNGADLTVGYAYTDATEVSPMTSSVASSNFDNTALLDLNNPRPGTSNYVVPHRLTFRYSHPVEIFGNLETRFTFYGTASEGQPQSYVMFSNPLEGDGFFGRHLLYVPTGLDDPNVVFGENFDTDAFFEFVNREGLVYGFQPRNSTHAKWSRRLDMRIDQELPTFREGVYARVFLKMYNVLNFIDDDWGEQWDAQFFSQQVVYGDVNDDGQYVFERFQERDINFLRQQSSLWEIRLGIDINF